MILKWELVQTLVRDKDIIERSIKVRDTSRKYLHEILSGKIQAQKVYEEK